jgi:hypothetical protein
MMFKNKNKLAFVLSLIAFAGATTQTVARPNINEGLRQNNDKKGGQLRTTASCKPAEASIDLDINNVRARLMTGGDMWWDNGTSEARYEVPKGSRKNSLFAGSVWIGGFDAQGQLKVAAQTYRQSGNDYWPGPLDPQTAEIDAATCSEWDKMWKVDKETINRFRELTDWAGAIENPDNETIKQWPAKGNKYAIGRNQNNLDISTTQDYAPFINKGGTEAYEPELGDYPDIEGDQYVWWVFNDKGNIKGESSTEGIGIEVQASAFAFSTKDFLNDATFYNYRLINRGNLSLDSTYIATWTDADLGYYKDDFIGCDTSRGLGILYNGKSVDGQGEVSAYGNKVPMVAIDFFKGPKKTYKPAGSSKDTTIELKMEAFTYYNNDFSIIGNPRNGNHIYNYMTGSITNGERFTNDFGGPNVNSKGYGSGPITKYVFTGDPGVKTEWSECACNNPVDDRRFVHSSGPFKLEPGVVNDITIGAVWVADVGGCPNTSFRKIRAADDLAQALFNNAFETTEGPEAPRMVARAMDRKLVFYLLNDEVSNNAGEKFGRDTAKKHRVSAITAKPVKVADSLYKFEGYRVFQVKNSEVQPAQIFNDQGVVNSELAIEVFQCDVKNGVSRIVNYEKNTDISDTTWIPIVKVNGKDSGISHSFEVTIDQFATTDNKRLVNYRNYYFVAISYAYNQFNAFTLSNIDSSQDKPYIESSKGQGGAPIPVVVGMPNPANGNMGTILNSDYGDGVVITRLEGTGNGGNNLTMSQESEDEALIAPAYRSLHPKYLAGKGPVDIKVVDPVRVKPHEWTLYLDGPTNTDTNKGLTYASTWRLMNNTNGETIYGEKNLDTVVNEQILEHYGLSVTLRQVVRPGDDQPNGNGYITSSITYKDQAKPWLVGVQDAEGREFTNWIRSGGVTNDTFSQCNFNDLSYDTSGQFYEKMMANYSATTGTWAPYTLGSDEARSFCGFGTVRSGTAPGLFNLPSVDLVLTSDKSKWTRCVVLEMQDVTDLSEGGVKKFDIRSHKSWNLDVDGNGRPVYSTNAGDTGMSWFPGYAVNQETGERLNIIFSEDSWLKSHNGNDMIWNPTAEALQFDGTGLVNKIFGGKHFVYILNTKYDEGAQFRKDVSLSSGVATRNNAYRTFQWVGMPTLNPGFNLTSFDQGFIPTETRLQFRVQRPYARYKGGDVKTNNGNPLYQFSTKNLAPTDLVNNENADKQALLDKIHAVPNPYYGYAGYEVNKLDTRVRIINLPRRATINIYSLDGSLINRVEKDNPNVSYADWNLRNTKGLPVASGMYLIHVQAEGIGETVIRWFGAMRPIDITTY